MELTCYNCEKPVQPRWKFCRYCGSKLDHKPQEIVEEEPDIEEVQETEPEVEFDKELYTKVLTTRAERSALISRKKELRAEISSLLDQVKAGVVDREYALPKIKKLKEQVAQVVKEEEKFEDIPEDLPIEVLNDQIEAAEKRIKKIEKLKRDENVTQQAIKEAKQRAKETLDMLKDQQSRVFGHLRVWVSELEEEIKNLRKESELLYIKMKTEEITQETYEERKEKLVKDIQVKENMAHMLKNLMS